MFDGDQKGQNPVGRTTGLAVPVRVTPVRDDGEKESVSNNWISASNWRRCFSENSWKGRVRWNVNMLRCRSDTGNRTDTCRHVHSECDCSESLKCALEQNKAKLTLSLEINGEEVVDICSDVSCTPPTPPPPPPPPPPARNTGRVQVSGRVEGSSACPKNNELLGTADCL